MLETLDTINWSQLYHAYGLAIDVPDQLRALAAPDQATWSRAIGQLYGNIYHQGTRWEASCYTIPFLCELVDSPSVQCRDAVLRLLLHVALGDAWPDDETLPYDPQQRFRTTEGVIAADWHALARRLYEEEDEPDAHIQRKLEQLGVAWDRDAHVAMHVRADKLLHWAVDSDDRVALCAVAGMPWFANIHQAASLLLLEQLASNHSIAYRATVLLTFGLMPSTARLEVKRALEQQVETATSFVVRLSSAIALVSLFGSMTSEVALQPLLEAEDHSAELDAMFRVIPYQRPLMGFRARALHRLGF